MWCVARVTSLVQYNYNGCVQNLSQQDNNDTMEPHY